jgi:hypothetical protein
LLRVAKWPMICGMNTDKPPIPAQVRAIENLKAFSDASRIPYRTLVRLKAADDAYKVSGSTKAAFEFAMKKIKPKLKDPGFSVEDQKA